MCIYICVEVVLINILASHLAPPNKNSWLRPCMYRIDTYTGIETPTFRTSLNTGHTGHLPADFRQYQAYQPVHKKKYFSF